MTPSPPFSPILALAAQWQVLGMLAVAIGRRVSLATKMRARAGVHEAEMLEAWLYAALVQLSGQITELSGPRAPTCPEEARALDYLKTVQAMLGVLALMIAQMRRDLAAITAERCADLPILAMRLPAASGYDPAFLDSG